MTELQYLIDFVGFFANPNSPETATVPIEAAHLNPLVPARQPDIAFLRGLWTGCYSPEIKRSAASHSGEEYAGRRPER